jgi:hypothetical protein
MIDLSKQGHGALIQPVTLRDYRLESIPGAVVLPSSFSLRDRVGKIKSQNGSSSCSSQATSYYAEVLNNIETGEKVQLSPKFLYAFVAYPYEGSYIKDNFARVCNAGIALESDIPSYQGTDAPSEAFMVQKPGITPEVAERAMTHWARKYVTWDNNSVDLYKRAIIQGNGCVVASWGNNILWSTGKNGVILLPDYREQMTWLHAIYLTGFFTISDADDELVKNGLMTMDEARRRYDEGISK